MGTIQGDTRNLDYSSFKVSSAVAVGYPAALIPLPGYKSQCNLMQILLDILYVFPVAKASHAHMDDTSDAPKTAQCCPKH